MTTPESILNELDAIAGRLAARPDALALIGLGSVGLERERLDARSDIDFFAIVAAGAKNAYLADLAWLFGERPPRFCFRNTADGFKALTAGGVFLECAVFEPAELEHIPFAPGRVVWRREDVSEAIARPRRPLPTHAASDRGWLAGEALSNLHVGLSRYLRGERWSAARFVQVYAADRLLELIESGAPEPPPGRDPFSLDRRFEQRHPRTTGLLPLIMPGYDRTPQAAAAILDALEASGDASGPIVAHLRGLIGEALVDKRSV